MHGPAPEAEGPADRSPRPAFFARSRPVLLAVALAALGCGPEPANFGMGSTYSDNDGDGFGSVEGGGDDCDDGDATIHPGAEEVCGDGVDQNCNGIDAECDEPDPEPEGEEGASLSEADAKLWPGQASFDAGRLVDVGDVDGDGVGELLIATLNADRSNGGGYLVDAAPTGSHDLDSVGIRFVGSSETSHAGRSIGMGDVDGDGLEDVLFGSPNSEVAGAWIVLAPITSTVHLEDEALRLIGEPSTNCGHGADLADVTGDGVADAVVGAYSTNNGGGTVFVVDGPITQDVDMVTAADAVLEGRRQGGGAGRRMRAGGDLNGDGVGDILVPAPYLNATGAGSGMVYVVHGPVSGVSLLEDAEGQLAGEGANAYAGESLAMGDVNDDGLSDVVVGAPMTSAIENQAGAAYVVFGPATGSSNLGDAQVTIYGARQDQNLGRGVATGLVDDDGWGDLLIGAPNTTGTVQGGAAYLFVGLLTGGYTTEDASFVALGENDSDRAGWGVAIGDPDGDGRGDLIIGAPYEDTGGGDAGAAYVLFGVE